MREQRRAAGRGAWGGQISQWRLEPASGPNLQVTVYLSQPAKRAEDINPFSNFLHLWFYFHHFRLWIKGDAGRVGGGCCCFFVASAPG